MVRFASAGCDSPPYEMERTIRGLDAFGATKGLRYAVCPWRMRRGGSDNMNSTHRRAWASRVQLVEDSIACPSVAVDIYALAPARRPPADAGRPRHRRRSRMALDWEQCALLLKERQRESDCPCAQRGQSMCGSGVSGGRGRGQPCKSAREPLRRGPAARRWTRSVPPLCGSDRGKLAGSGDLDRSGRRCCPFWEYARTLTLHFFHSLATSQAGW